MYGTGCRTPGSRRRDCLAGGRRQSRSTEPRERLRGRGWKGVLPFESGGQHDVQWLNKEVFDGQRFAVGLETFKIDGDGFAEVGDGFVKRVAFGMTAGQRGTHGVKPAIGLSFEYRRVSHEGSLADRAMRR